MITIQEKNEESGTPGYIYGMNTVDDPRDLNQGECQLLENTLPGRILKPRSAIVDLFVSTDALGRGNEYTEYTPHSVLISNPDGEDYVIVWTREIINTDVFVIETIKISDGTRTALMTAKFSSVDTVCSMKKLYSSVYCAFSHSVVENYTNRYLLNNVIIYWDDKTNAWAVRSWGINFTPKIDAINCIDTGGEIRLDARSGASATIMGGFIYLVNGIGASGRKLDSLITYNLTNWNSKTVEPVEYLLDENGEKFIDDMVVPAEWSGREGHRLVSFQNRLWMMGGESDAGLMNDMWYSDDGSLWYRYITTCDWTARKDFAVAVFNNKLFLLGGSDASGANDEVWSFDGTAWTEKTTATGFTARDSHEALVYDNKLWVVMGTGKTDVINSVDGITWTSVVANAGLGARENFGLISHDNKMWVVGGYNGSNYLKSVYSSTDGITWANVTSTAAWTERAGHITLSFGGKMYVVTGYDGTNYLSDIWYSEDGATWNLVLTGLTKNKYYGYAFTTVRRVDSLSFLTSMTEYNYEPWESYDGRVITGVNEKLLSGTVALTGTALTGSDTSFQTELIVGDRIRIDGSYNYYTLTEITDDENAVVENDAGDSYTDANFALLPADGDSITTGNYNAGIDESPESVDVRQIVQCASSTNFGRSMIPLPLLDDAVAQGATHLRIFRTIGGETSTVAAGLTFLYLVDISLTSRTYDSDNYYRDELSDDIQRTETHSIETNGYAVAPFGKYLTWDQERMWMSTGKGFWLFSVGASQDVEYPQKFASLFNGSTQRIVCDPEDGQEDTGSVLFDGDLYLFKNRKIHILDTANPSNIPRPVSESIGCDFPNTLNYVDHPQIGKSVSFLSNSGPAVLQAGGSVTLYSRFKLKELWPDGYLHIDLATHLERSSSWKEKVFSCWFKNAWRIFVPGQSIPTIYSFYIDPDEEISGSFVDTIPLNVLNIENDPSSIVIKNDQIAYTLSNKSNVYRISQFLKSGEFRDKFSGAYFSYHQKSLSRFRGLNRDCSIMGELSDVVLHLEMKEDSGLSVTAYCDKERFSATMDYSEGVDTALEEASYNNIRTMINGILKEGAYGRCFSVLVDKIVPESGDFTFSGVDMNIQPFEEFQSEFTGTFGERQKGW